LALTVGWDDDQKTITCIEFQDTYTLDELINAWKREQVLFASVDHPVYSLNIFDGFPVVQEGFDVGLLRNFLKANPVPNLQMTIQVSESAFFRSFLRSLATLMPNETVHVVADREAAYTLIDAHRGFSDLQ
jgi:hypothetical protein